MEVSLGPGKTKEIGGEGIKGERSNKTSFKVCSKVLFIKLYIEVLTSEFIDIKDNMNF